VVHRFELAQLTRGIGNVLSRRGLLQGSTLGALTLGHGLHGSIESSAKKKKKSRKKGDPNALCKRQVGQCETLISGLCGDGEECLAVIQNCCPILGTCNLGGFVACFDIEASNP
jgi:hypothetical protein